jgi:hypothetical protein
MEETVVKRGRKKKDQDTKDIKKKRGRKPAFEYYTTSACKRNTTKKSDDTSNTIIQLDISDTESINAIEPNDLERGHFKELDIVERYYNELKENCDASLEDLYNTELDERKKQDTEFYDTLDKVVESQPVNSTDIKDTHTHINVVNVLCDFVDVDWPSTTSVLCWWCCKDFNSVPVGVPIKYNKALKKFVVKGIFCSMPCMYAYTLDYDNITLNTKKYKFNKKHQKIDNLDSLIRDLDCKLTGASIGSKLVPALPRESLIDFGGELSIEAFRDYSKGGRIFNRIEYPFTVVKDFIEIKDIDLIKKNQEIKNEGTEKIVIKEIVKPIQRQTIDSILNLEYD